MITVNLTAEDIANGIAGDCHRCAVALALTRATKDDEAMVYDSEWTIHLSVWGRSITAPYEVRHFTHEFDGQPRTEAGRIDTNHRDYKPMDPFDFELPDQDDPEWEQECYECGESFDPSDLDDEGYCKECLGTKED